MSVFAQIDVNGDGQVDRIEFIKFMKFLLSGAAILTEADPELKKFRKLFDMIDRDRSGVISIGEFQCYFAARKCPLTLKQIRELFDRIDANVDGKLSFDEFVLGIRKFDKQENYAKDSDELYERIFKQLDTNNSGNLSIQEVATGIVEFGYLLT